MKITLLGTGGPRPDPARQGSSLVVNVGEEWLLFDCGRGAVTQFVRAGAPLEKLNPVFITHHHFDHISDLGDVILSTWLQAVRAPCAYTGRRERRKSSPPSSSGSTRRTSASGRRGSPPSGAGSRWKSKKPARGLVCDGGGWKVHAEFVEHGQGLGIPDFDWVTLGYRLEAAGKTLAISGDTIPCAGLDRLARGADVLVLCCYLAEAEVTDPHTERLTRHLFPSSAQAGKIAAGAGVKTLVLTHFREKPDHLMHAIEEDVRRDFSGEVILGRDLLEIEV